MARIRTIKPEFWEDETIAMLSRDARLLMLATLNMADDEGILRWSPEYVKSSAFMYDDDITTAVAALLMRELVDAELLFAYRGGKAMQNLALIVNFHKHQKINRPQPSKLPAPSLQNAETLTMYKRRDNLTCHLCGYLVNDGVVMINDREGSKDLDASPDHVIPRSEGGSDYPSNIRISHVSCNKSRGNRGIASFAMPRSVRAALVRNGSLNDSVNDATNMDEDFSAGREGKGKEEGREGSATATPFCIKHPEGTDSPCRACGTARRAFDAALAAEKNKPTPTPPRKSDYCPEHDWLLKKDCDLEHTAVAS